MPAKIFENTYYTHAIILSSLFCPGKANLKQRKIDKNKVPGFAENIQDTHAGRRYSKHTLQACYSIWLFTFLQIFFQARPQSLCGIASKMFLLSKSNQSWLACSGRHRAIFSDKIYAAFEQGRALGCISCLVPTQLAWLSQASKLANIELTNTHIHTTAWNGACAKKKLSVLKYIARFRITTIAL